MPTQHIATMLGATCCVRLANMLRCVGCCWLSLKMAKFKPTTHNTSQHIATWWPNARNMLRPTLLRFVALACCDRLAGALNSQRQIQKALMVFKSLNGLVPEYLTSKFVPRNVSNYALRDSANKLAVPFPRTNYMKNSFSYSGATLWNSLHHDTRESSSLDQFGEVTIKYVCM